MQLIISAKEIMFLIVCLSVGNISEQVVHTLQWNVFDGSGVMNGANDYISVVG